MNDFQNDLQKLNVSEFKASEATPWNAQSHQDARYASFVSIAFFNCTTCFTCANCFNCHNCTTTVITVITATIATTVITVTTAIVEDIEVFLPIRQRLCPLFLASRRKQWTTLMSRESPCGKASSCLRGCSLIGCRGFP